MSSDMSYEDANNVNLPNPIHARLLEDLLDTFSKDKIDKAVKDHSVSKDIKISGLSI